MKTDKIIIDVTCGGRSIWFDKHNKDTVYCDIRAEHSERVFGTVPSKRTVDVEPDVVCDFTNLPFDDNSFSLCVFDPPHLKDLSDKSWLVHLYGTLTDGWEQMLAKGFSECMRVLKPRGTLILKWADTSISTRDLINAIGQDPLFGHRSGKKMGTHWLTFMKMESTAQKGAAQ